VNVVLVAMVRLLAAGPVYRYRDQFDRLAALRRRRS
jgi:hypothetical protein